MGDIVGGFFILFEGLFLVGGLVEVASVRGRVEEVGVRMTKVRDDARVLHAIPNGVVRKVSSHSKGYVHASLDVRGPYDEDNARGRALLNQVGEAAADRVFRLQPMHMVAEPRGTSRACGHPR